jgi:hypothetical protein
VIIKLISPLKIQKNDGTVVSLEKQLEYMPYIQARLHEDMITLFEDGESFTGLVQYFSDHTMAKAFTKTTFVTVERLKVEDKTRLMGVCYCVLDEDAEKTENLLDNIIQEIKKNIIGQYSDGWGEGFEQKAIETFDEEIYVSFWSGDDGWNIEVEKPPTYKNILDKLEEALEKINNILEKD